MKIFLFFFVTFVAMSSSFMSSKVFASEQKGERFSCEFIVEGSSHKLSYDTRVDVGKSIKHASHDLLLWHEDDKLKVMVRGGQLKKPESSAIKLEEEKLTWALSTGPKFQCQKDIEKKESLSLEKLKNLADAKEKLQIKILKDLKFRAVQTEENQLMRTLFFQNGNVYINSNDMERRLNWCSLRVQLKEKKDTQILPGEIFKPLTFQVQENSSYFTTYSYSFVDFGKGKKSGETSRYAPFLFTCNLLRGMPYNLESFKSVVGEYLTFIVASSS